METEKREIYLAKDFEELNKRVSDNALLDKAKTASCASIGNLIESTWSVAKQAEQEQDEEKAYVLYMRMFECLKLMRQCKDILSNQQTLNHYRKGAEIWLEKADDISKSLKTRYDQINAKKLEEQRKRQEEIDEENSLTGSIQARLLYKYLNKVKRNILLIDMRSKLDYDQSHLKISSCIHIPADLVAGKGWTSWGVEAALTDETAKRLFKNRANYDYIVLFDKSSYEEDLKPNHPLLGLKQAIYSYDRDTKLKHEPLILQGGYFDWMTFYPTESTAPLITQDDDNEFRSFERTYPEDAIIDEKPVQDEIHIPEPESSIISPTLIPSIDRTRKPLNASKTEIPVIEPEEPIVTPAITVEEPSVVVPVQPLIPDRTTKPQPSVKTDSEILTTPTTVDIPVRPSALKPIDSNGQIKADQPVTPKSVATTEVLPNREKLALYRPFTSFTPVDDSNAQYQKRFDRVTGRKVFLDTKTNRSMNILPNNSTLRLPTINNQAPAINRDIKPLLTESVRRQIAAEYYAVSSPLQVNRRTGLKNLGNSCYMNSVIQALSFNLTLTNYFLSGEFNKSINVNNRLGSRGVIAREWFRLMYALWSEQHAYVSPYPFKAAVGSLQRAYLETQQQDAHEFLVFLVDSLHEDLNQAARPKVEELKSENYPNDQKFAEATKINFSLHNQSTMIDLFYGLFKSTTICMTCSYPSYRFEPFAIISVPIPRVRQTSLDECLKLFHEYENLTGDESYRCSKCKKITEKRRGLEIWELPKLFIVHFKRFRPQQHYYIKNETLIRYKLSNVDFSRWSKTPNSTHYSLVSVVNHYGSMNSGHYTSFCNDGKRWYYCDDQNIRPADQNEIENNVHAYLLFYSSIPQPSIRLPIVSAN